MFVHNLRQISTLGAPHGSRSQSQNNGSRDQGVEFRVKLSGDVSGVAENGDHHGPFDRQFLDHKTGDKHAGDDQCGINNRQRVRAQSINLNENRMQYKYISFFGVFLAPAFLIPLMFKYRKTEHTCCGHTKNTCVTR